MSYKWEDKTPWVIQRGWNCGAYFYMYNDKGKRLESCYIGALEDIKKNKEKNNV